MTEKKNKSERTIEFTLSGDAVQDGRVSVKLFASSLYKIQSVVNNLAKSRLKIDPSIPGRLSSDIAVHTELYLIKTKEGSFTAELAFPQKTEDLFPDYPDFEENIISDTQGVLDAISNKDKSKLKNILPNPRYRQRVIKDIVSITPGEREDYSLNIRVGGGEKISMLKPNREEISVLMDLPTPIEKFETHKSIVLATGLAEMEEGTIKNWLETYDVQEEEFDLERSWRPKKISWASHIYILTHPIVCVVIQEKKGFTVEYSPLKIYTLGETREEAQEAFSEEFDILYNEFAEEEDHHLTKDAQELKLVILNLIKTIQIV